MYLILVQQSTFSPTLRCAMLLLHLWPRGGWRKLSEETTLGLFRQQKPGRESQHAMAKGKGECQQRPPNTTQHSQHMATHHRPSNRSSSSSSSNSHNNNNCNQQRQRQQAEATKQQQKQQQE